MPTFIDKVFPDTPGALGRALAWMVAALLGGGMALAVVARLADLGAPGSGVWALSGLWVFAAGVVGALGGLVMTLDRFGAEGGSGWGRAAVGVTVLCFSGSLIAGSLVLPVFGTMFGPLALVTTMLSSPMSGLAWLVALLTIHPLMRRWHRERDAILYYRAGYPAPVRSQGALDAAMLLTLAALSPGRGRRDRPVGLPLIVPAPEARGAGRDRT